MQARRVYVAHDIEKAGVQMIKHPVVSVGFVIADDMDVLQTRKFNIVVNWYKNVDGKCVDYGDFEKRTVDEFWNRVPIDTQNLKTNAKPADEAWADIGRFIDQLETEYPDAEIIFLTDNNSFDTANIDYNLELYTKRAPMRFSTTGAYRAVLNADDMFSMMPTSEQDAAKKLIAERVAHDHDPVNDAQFIYELYIHARLYRDNQIQTDHVYVKRLGTSDAQLISSAELDAWTADADQPDEPHRTQEEINKLTRWETSQEERERFDAWAWAKARQADERLMTALFAKFDEQASQASQ